MKANKFRTKYSFYYDLFISAGYAATSLFALFAGFFIQNTEYGFNSLDVSEFLLLLILFLLTIPFFYIYGKIYPSNHHSSHDQSFSMQTFITIIIFVVLVVIIIFNSGYDIFSLDFCLYSGTYIFLFYFHAIIIHKLKRKEKEYDKDKDKKKIKVSDIRYRLVWPVIFSISLSMYFGMNLNSIGKDYIVYIPIIIILLLYSISLNKKIGKNSFGGLNLGFLIIALVLLIYHKIYPLEIMEDSFENYLSLILFSIFSAGYLAVFEAWKITDEVKEKDLHKKYSIATSFAFIASIIIVPFAYIFVNFGIIFLIGFILHSITTFICWYFIIDNDKSSLNEIKLRVLKPIIKTIKNIKIPILKTIIGFIFLVVLVWDSISKDQLFGQIDIQFISFSGLGVLLAFYILVLSLSHDFKNSQNTSHSIANLFYQYFYMNIIRAIIPLSILMCFILLIINDFQNYNDIVSIKSTHAFLLYTVIAIAGIIYEIFYRKGKHNPDNLVTIQENSNNKKNTLKYTSLKIRVVGFFQTTRILVSSIIGLIIFIPIYSMNFDVFVSISKSLPFLLAAMGGFALNDFFDIKRDKVNKPYRAIPSGKLNSYQVKFIAFVLLLISFIYSYFFSESGIELFLFLSANVGVIIYNFVVKKIAFFKTIVTAVLCSLPLLYIIIMLKYNSIYFLLAFATCIFIIGRELLMDIIDLKGDEASGIITLPKIIGYRASTITAFSMQFLAALLLVPIVITLSSPFYTLNLSIIIISIIILNVFWLLSINNRPLIIKLFWTPMIFGVLMLL